MKSDSENESDLHEDSVPTQSTASASSAEEPNESDLNEDSVPTLSQAERKLHVYNTLREEILKNAEITLRQNTRGIALIVITIGYSLQFGPKTVIGIVPGILGYLFIRNAESQVWMTTHARQIIEIEGDLSQSGSSFRYEIRRGGLLGTDQTGLLNFKYIPSILRIITAGVAYIASVLYVIEVIWLDSSQKIAGITVTSRDLWLVYGTLSVLIITAVVATVMHRKELQEDARNDLDDLD